MEILLPSLSIGNVSFSNKLTKQKSVKLLNLDIHEVFVVATDFCPEEIKYRLYWSALQYLISKIT